MSGGTGFIGVNGNITSQMTSFVKTGDMSGYIPTSESSKYQLTADMSSFATTAQLSGKLDSSAQVVTSTGGSSYYVNKINGSSILAETATRSTYATFVTTTTGAKRLDDMWSSITSLETSNSGKLDSSAQVVTATATGHSINFGDFVSGINGMEIYATEAKNAVTASYAKSARVTRRSGGETTITNVPFSAFALESSVSSKLDASASSDFYYATNPSAFVGSADFGFDSDSRISSIGGSALVGGFGYDSPSGTLAINNTSGSIDAWNSSMRVDEEVTPASSVSGSGYNEYGYITKRILNNISSISGDTLYVNVVLTGAASASATFYGSIIGGGSAVLTSMEVSGAGGSQSSYYSATATLNDSYSAIWISASSQWGTPPSCSATATVERSGSTAYSTSVYEQVLKDSMWQSLTAWATAQGWTP